MTANVKINRGEVIVNDEEFWKLDDIEDSYWNDYVATRPTYDQRITDPIYEYHGKHSSSFNKAIDIGCGAGSAAQALLSRFQHVIASDNDPRSLHVATQKLARVPKERVTYILSTGEDIRQHCAPESIDLVANAEGFPLMDTDESLHAFHTILSRNGTLAVWFYGRINFTDPDFRPQCQPILDRILDLAFQRIVSGCGPERQRAWKHAADGMSSWLDYIPFDPVKWQDVRRHKWNPHLTLPFFGPDACDFDVVAKSSVTDNEMTSSETDAEFWRKDLDSEGVRRFVAAAFPWPAELTSPTAEMAKLFGDLEVAMGGANVKHAFSWPAVLILASKRA